MEKHRETWREITNRQNGVVNDMNERYGPLMNAQLNVGNVWTE